MDDREETSRALWRRSVTLDQRSGAAAPALSQERAGTPDLWRRSASPDRRTDTAALLSDEPWRSARVTPVQLVIPVPPPPGIASTNDDRTTDAAARELQRIFGHALQTFETRERDGFRRDLDALARAATALDHLLDSVEYRGQLRDRVETLLQTRGESLAASQPGGPDRDPLEVHHTVPYGAPRAEDARAILEKWNISINDPVNAAILPRSYHRGEDVHGGAGDDYSESVTRNLEQADGLATSEAAARGRAAGRADMFEALRDLSDELVAASGDARAVALEATLRATERLIPRPDVPVAAPGLKLMR